MRFLLVLCSFALAACTAVEVPDLERAQSPIINGTREPQRTTLTEAQKMSLGFLHSSGSPGNYYCSATLIAPQVVITAAHCTNSAWQMGFGIGVNPSNANAWFQVAEVHNHPVHDIAILILDEDVTHRLPQIEPLPWNDQPITQQHVGEWIEVCGYGDTYDRNRQGRWCGVSQILNLDDDAIVVNGHGQQGICFGDSGGGSLMMFDGEPRVMAVVSEGELDYCLGGREWLVRTEFVGDWVRNLAGDPHRTDPCDGVPADGVCDGSVLRRCSDGVFQEQDCGALGTGCGYVSGQGGLGCDCSGIPAEGSCAGDVLTHCEQGGWAQRDCASQGLTCAFSGAAGAFGCDDVTTEPEPDGEEPREPGGDEPGLDAPPGDGAWVDDAPAGDRWADGPGAQRAASAAQGCSAGTLSWTRWTLRRR